MIIQETDNEFYLLFQNHGPEISECWGQRQLCYNGIREIWSNILENKIYYKKQSETVYLDGS